MNIATVVLALLSVPINISTFVISRRSVRQAKETIRWSEETIRRLERPKRR